MKYTYIKQRHGKTEETKIRFASDSEERATHMETEIKSEEGAPPEFIEAMEALTPDFLEILGLPKEYGEGLEVHTLSLRHSGERWGVVMSGSKTLEATKGPFNPSTPILFQPKETDGYGKVGTVTRQLEEKILKVIGCADAFRKGARAQQELELDGTPKKTGRGTGDLTPIEEEVERQAKTFRAGELPAEAEESAQVEEDPEAEGIRTPFDDEDEDEDGQPSDSPFRTRLTSVDAINPTMIAILSQADIHTLQEMARAGREAVAALKGLGPAKMSVLDGALADAELAWADTTDEEDREAEADDEPEDTAIETDTGMGDLHPEEPAIGQTVVPEQNQSFTLEVADRDGDRVILKRTGVAADGRFRYSDRDAMSWDAENDRWLTSRIHILAENEKPAEMPV